MEKNPDPKDAVVWALLTPSQRRVVRCFRQHGSLTREQLGLRLEWPASSVSREVSPLLAQRVLVSNPPGTRRRNALLSNAATLGYAIGLELGFDVVRAVVVDFNGTPVGVAKVYQPDNREPPAFLRCVQKVLRELFVQPQARQAMGIGIGYADRATWNPARVFSADRAPKPMPPPPLVESVRADFDLPVLSRCDAACAALGEWRSGRLRGVENGLFLLYAEGIGLGIIARGRVVFGDWDDAGEIGHIPIVDEGEYCHCGNVGCLETVAAQWALSRKAKQIVETGGLVGFRRPPSQHIPRVDELCAMATAGDLLARNMLAKAGRALGRALAISASLFDPAAIVLGGALATPEAYGPLIGSTRETFEALTAHRTPQPIRMESSALGQDAMVIGAAELVFSELLG